jgi:hypothetical protein
LVSWLALNSQLLVVEVAVVVDVMEAAGHVAVVDVMEAAGHVPLLVGRTVMRVLLPVWLARRRAVTVGYGC